MTDEKTKKGSGMIVESMPDDCVAVDKYGKHELRLNEYFYSKSDDLFYHKKGDIIKQLFNIRDRKIRYISAFLKDQNKNIKIYFSIFSKERN
jgi:hypothetical protein